VGPVKRGVGYGRAVHDQRPSFTASWVAGWRGLGHLLGDDQIADDPYGARFGGRWAEALARAGASSAVRAGLIRLPQVASWVGYMQVRTRLFDDELRSFLANGGRQVVILGAGYDCRAARFATLLAGATVFEIDHPATQQRKRAVLAERGADPAVTYVPWHFERRALAELPGALAELGLDLARPTLTVWEGVTMYLSPEAIDATIAAVRDLGGDGSRLVFNYLTREVLERPRGLVRLASAAVASLGEPFTFGWDPGELPAFFAARGWSLSRDTDFGDVTERLLPRHVAARCRFPERHIAVATRA
jgi:methyltransferase (TIGR00027 family)